MTTQFRTKSAMVFAAGLGVRMRPLTNDCPKALLELDGRTLLDRTIDQAITTGVERVVVNCHHFAPLLRSHLEGRTDVDIRISEEHELLETGGGVQAALPMIGDQPFLTLNSDSLWTDANALAPLLETWPSVASRADALLLLVDSSQAVSHLGGGDFTVGQDGLLKRRSGESSALIYTGAQILDPRALRGMPQGRWSLNRLWDQSIKGRHLFGVSLASGRWVDAGTPEGLTAGAAEIRMAASRASD